MQKYINESYLLDALGVFSDRKNGNLHFLSGIKSAQEIIEDAPVEVTVMIGRCSQCDNFSKKDSWCYPKKVTWKKLIFVATLSQ